MMGLQGLTRLLLVMLGSEFGQIFLILGILGGFLVLRKLGIVLFLGSGCLAFTSLPCPRRESLPPFTYKFGDLGKTQLLSFQGLSRLCMRVSAIDWSRGTNHVRFEKIT